MKLWRQGCSTLVMKRSDGTASRPPDGERRPSMPLLDVAEMLTLATIRGPSSTAALGQASWRDGPPACTATGRDGASRMESFLFRLMLFPYVRAPRRGRFRVVDNPGHCLLHEGYLAASLTANKFRGQLFYCSRNSPVTARIKDAAESPWPHRLAGGAESPWPHRLAGGLAGAGVDWPVV